MSPKRKTGAHKKKRTTKKPATTSRSTKTSASKTGTYRQTSTNKSSANKPRPIGKAGNKRKNQSADTLMNTFVFAIVVFLAL